MPRMEYSDVSERDAFVVNLSRGADHSLAVTSVELVQSHLRNCFHFEPTRSFHDLFDVRLADALKASLERLAKAERGLFLPDFELAMPGLILSGLQIRVTPAEDGTESIMMRINRYIGAIKSAFLFDESMVVDPTSAREKIAVDVLQDIMTPLFDLMALDLPGMDAVIEKHAPAIQKRLSQLNAKQEELVFFTGLLQRYVAGCQQDARRDQGKRLSAADFETIKRSA